MVKEVVDDNLTMVVADTLGMVHWAEAAYWGEVGVAHLMVVGVVHWSGMDVVAVVYVLVGRHHEERH